MKNRLLPQTSKGEWSVSLFAAFLVLGIAANRISSAIGNSIEYPNPINSPLLGSVIYLAFTAAILASLMGILAVKKDQERSILVFLLIPIGLFFLVAIVGFMIANLIGPRIHQQNHIGRSWEPRNHVANSLYVIVRMQTLFELDRDL